MPRNSDSFSAYPVGDELAVVVLSCSARSYTQASGVSTFDLRIGRRDCVHGGLMSFSLLSLSEAFLPDIL
jgi:hypothetical protein